jgi:4-aminobutyrate aminotransferase
VDGNRFLDMNAGIAVVATGPLPSARGGGHPAAGGQLIHMSGTDFYYENMVLLAEKLAALAPGRLPRRVYFGNSGAEAVEARAQAGALLTPAATSSSLSWAASTDAPWGRSR